MPDSKTEVYGPPEPPQMRLVRQLRDDFKEFESVYLPGRNNGSHPDWLMCNRLWRLFQTVARRVEISA